MMKMTTNNNIDNTPINCKFPYFKSSHLFNLELFKETIYNIQNRDKRIKQNEINKRLSLPGLIKYYQNKDTKKIVLSNAQTFEYPHEYSTAQKLTDANYHVIFVPKGYFKRSEKKFDVFLLYNWILLESDLKCISTANPDTIGKRIKEGS